MQGKRAPAASILIFVLCILLFALAVLLVGRAAGITPPFWGASSAGAPASQAGSSAGSPASRVVIIDAGHGGEDGGASGASGVLEKDLNLDIALIISDMLKANGLEVILTRESDILLYDRNIDYRGRKKMLDLKARLKIADDNPGALFVSIHMNSFPQKQYSGLQVYYSKNAPASEELADMIQETVRGALQPGNTRRPKSAGSNIYILHKAQNTAVMVECGFLSNTAECELLSDPQYRQRLSLTIFAAISEYIYKDSIVNPNNP